MKYIQIISASVSTLFGIGYMPFPGSIATLITFFALYYGSYHTLPISMKWIGIAALTVIAFVTITSALSLFKKRDPKEIVIDETIGSLLALLYAQTPLEYGICFVLFRFFDISKRGGILYIERFAGALGIVGDDLVAGLYSVCIYMAIKIFILNAFFA